MKTDTLCAAKAATGTGAGSRSGITGCDGRESGAFFFLAPPLSSLGDGDFLSVTYCLMDTTLPLLSNSTAVSLG